MTDIEKTLEDLRFFKVILRSIADGVFTVDSNHFITSFNPAAEKITGIPASKAIGKRCYDIFHSDICQDCLLDATLKTGQEAVDRPVNIIDIHGNVVPISISTAVLRDDTGTVLGAVETFRDLSAIENLRKELNQRYSFEDIISKSPKINKLFSILPDISESESTVLIQGPSGSGKELFARAIHNLSPRKDHDYVVINCGTLPPQLFESELFGYCRGAFTDAKRDKPGKLERANRGTVFFDEIGELPLSTQVKLLRLLQQREYEPIGCTSPVKSDIRVVAATNRNLKELVTQGKFRDDLYFRLAVVRIDLPPLRERREDIPYLVDHFIARYNPRLGKNIIGVSPEYMDVLMRHDFPGNIRELENTIEYGFVVCRGSILQRSHLPVELLSREMEDKADGSRQTSPITDIIDLEGQIRHALAHTGGNIAQTAMALGVHRTTLWRRLRRFNIDTNQYHQ